MKLLHTSLALGTLTVVNAQSRIFLESIYFWFASPDAWDAANSGCKTDSDCPQTGGDQDAKTCGLMEYLDLTSVQVTDWVPETRVKQCMNLEKECNKQLLHKYSGYRILTFCGEPMAERLKLMYVKDAHYFNLGVSDYQCIAYNVGQPCKDPEGHAGTCVMLETQNAQLTKVADFPRVQRQTLHTICLPKMQEEDKKITSGSDQGQLQKTMKFALSDIRLKNFELRMMDNHLVFCDKVSGKQTMRVPPLGNVDFETVSAFLDVDIKSERLEQFKVSGDCPTVGVGTKLSYIDNAEESDKLLLVVQNFFEQMYLRRYFYFPFFLLISIILLCLISYGIVWLVHVIFISQRDKKRTVRTRFEDGGRDHGPRNAITDADVKWPNTAEGKGWKIADYEKEMKSITELPEEAPARLDRFANLFSKALDLIVTALSTNRTIPHAIFRIRDAFAREIEDCELSHVLEHVDALVAVTQREQRTTEALTDKETKEVLKLKTFFEGELKARAPRPDLQELSNFQSSALYQDRIGQRLLNQNQYSLALFLRMYIQERFSAYKETIGQRFKDEKTQPKCSNWSVKNDFQKNAVQIWQHYTDYRKAGFFIAYRAWMINILMSTALLVGAILVLSAFVGIIFLGTALREQTLSSWGWILFPLLLCGLLWWGLAKIRNKEMWDLAGVDDLVQGSIEAPVGELQAAYLHFKGMPQIEIVEIKESLEEFQKVTVNYVYNQAFVGEMDFRFRPWTQVYHAKLFLQEISGAKKPIEVLQSLNYMEIFLSLNEQLDTDETAAILQERPQYKEDSDAELDLDAIEYTAKAQGDRAGSVFKGYTRPGEAGSLEMQGLKEGDEDSYAQHISNDIRESQQYRQQIVKKTTVTKTSNQIIS